MLASARFPPPGLSPPWREGATATATADRPLAHNCATRTAWPSTLQATFISRIATLVRKVSPDGFITTVAATSGELSFPAGLAVDPSGNLYIADVWNHRIRKVSPDGTITTVAGTGARGDSGDGGPAVNAQLYTPVAVAVDGSGNLYIGDLETDSTPQFNTPPPFARSLRTGSLPP